MLFSQDLLFDYDKTIEEYIYSVVKKELNGKIDLPIEIEINHTQSNAVIFEQLNNKLQQLGYCVYIRSDETSYNSKSTSSQFYEAETGLSIIIASSVNAEKRGRKNVSRKNKIIARYLAKKITSSSLILNGQVCYFEKKSIRTIFNDNKIDIALLDLSISYMEN